jgi:hypothetical protein
MRFANSACQTHLVFWDRYQVDVIRHEAPCQVGNAKPLPVFREEMQVGVAILVGQEDVQASNSALHNVMRHSGDYNTRYSCHVPILP